MPVNKIQETKLWEASSGTYGGVVLYVMAFGANVNQELSQADISATNMTLQMMLDMDGKTYTIHNDNLLNIATYSMRKNAYERWVNGLDVILPATSVKNQKMFVVDIKFRSPITVFPGCKLRAQYQLNQGFFGPNVDENKSLVDWIVTPSTGHMYGVPQFKAQVVQAAVANDTYIGGTDGVKHIEYVNYNQADITNQVMTNVNLQATGFSYGASFLELLASEQTKYPPNKPLRFTQALPNGTPPTVTMGLDWLPQSCSVFHADGSTLNACNLQVAWNGPLVLASQNWIMYDYLTVTQRIAAQAARAISNRAVRNIAALPSR